MRKKKQNTTLVDKLLAKKGPAVLTRAELQQLQAAFLDLSQANLDLSQTNLRLTRMVNGLAEALDRHNLHVTHTNNPDGSVGFDLELVPVTEPVTVN